MPLSFFKHDIRASRDPKCAQLIKALGWEGYGLFWGLVEALFEAKGCELEYSLPTLAWQFHCDEEIIRAVIEDFDLFKIGSGRFWSDGAKKRFDDYEMRAERRIEASRRAGKASGEARRARSAKRKTPVEETVTPQQAQEAPVEQTGTELDGDFLNAVEETNLAYSKAGNVSIQIIEEWNKVFDGTSQAYRGTFLDAASWKNARDSFQRGYSLEDLKAAFRAAKDDDFAWLLISAVKPDNVQRLLVKAEKGRDNVRTGKFAAEQSDPSSSWNAVDWAQFERSE